MATGKVVRKNDRGFGFIASHEDKQEVWFHATGMRQRGTFDELSVGDTVSYQLDNSGDRPRAVEVEPRR